MELLVKAKQDSICRLNRLRGEINERIQLDNICIYTCGSLGRLEITDKSDLDLFFILMNHENGDEREITNVGKYCFFGNMYKINSALGFQDPTKGGVYWDFITERQLLDIGSRVEDFNNSFTARMLLLLEGKPLYNTELYNQLKKNIIDKYFEEYEEHTPFYPLFLMNDIWRYWYTLTLNYEYRKDANDDAYKRYWKRLKLKYARFFTCLSLLMCLFKKDLTKEDVCHFSDMTPFERIEYLNENVVEFSEGKYLERLKTEYEWFLNLRMKTEEWWGLPNNKTVALAKADKFHLLLKEMLYVIAKTNPELAIRTELVFLF